MVLEADRTLSLAPGRGAVIHSWMIPRDNSVILAALIFAPAVTSMADSIKDQLMRTGLVDKKRAHQVRQQKQQEVKQARRGDAPADDSAERLRQAREEKVERDRQLEAQRQARRREREIAAQIRQMTRDSRIDRGSGDVPYQFTQGRKIKKLYVTATQQEQLTRGRVGIVALDEGFELVPARVAAKIQERDPAAVLVLNQPGSAGPSDDVDADPYADYPIPDDLMW